MMNQPKTIESTIKEVKFGQNVTIIQPVNLYGCTIGDDSFIGPFVEIQKGVEIGKRCRIQSHSFICERVTMGDDCFVSHGAMFVNHLFKNGMASLGRQALWRPTQIGNRVVIGTNSTILPVKIADNVVIGAGSVVIKDILKPGTYAGNPARFLNDIDRKR